MKFNERAPVRHRRREFIALLGGAAVAWPLAARAQQPAMPVIGFLNSQSPETQPDLAAFRQGLNEVGYAEGRNVTSEYRWANNQLDKLPTLAADLVRHRVAVIAATAGVATAIAAKGATTTIPIVFANGSDPVKFGLVAKLNQPGGNVTGVTLITNELGAKRLELLRELVPSAVAIAFLVNPSNPNAESDTADVQAAASKLGRQVHVLNASSERNLDTAFAAIAQMQPGAVLIAADIFFNARSGQLAALAGRHAIPTMHAVREFPASGGLISYGASPADLMRQAGILYRQGPQRCQASRAARAAADQIRVGDQPQDRQGARP
jgi:ABC-type uncharacterized transport system substrate-binding protein